MNYEAISQMNKMLGQLDTWLRTAEEHAKTRGFDPNAFVTFRLAPDQFDLVRQVQSACDTAKFSASRLTGREAPKHPDDERTMEQLHARIASVRSYLSEFQASDFAQSDTIVVRNARWEGKVMSGRDYLHEFGIPNFYFHLNHAYALLRQAGVPVGKRDYLGGLSLKAE